MGLSSAERAGLSKATSQCLWGLGLLLLQWPLENSTQESWLLWCWGRALWISPLLMQAGSCDSYRALVLCFTPGAVARALFRSALQFGWLFFFFLSCLKQGDFCCAAMCWMRWQLPAECCAAMGALRCVTCGSSSCWKFCGDLSHGWLECVVRFMLIDPGWTSVLLGAWNCTRDGKFTVDRKLVYLCVCECVAQDVARMCSQQSLWEAGA